MAQPDLIIVPFASSAPAANVDAIPISLSPSDPPQAASYSQGFPQVTMTPLAAGGIPPRGQSFNGVLQDITEHLVFMGHGGQYRWSAAYVAAKGGYDAGDVLQSNDGQTAYVSLINNNTTNFNTNPGSIGTAWRAWAGAGAVPPDASTTAKGLIQVATQAQVNSGTSGNMAVTPLALAVSVQNQSVSAFAATGTATAQAISPLPSISAYTPFQRFNVTFNAASGTNPTINVSGVGPKLLKRYDPAGAKVAATFVAGQNSDIVYDGVDFIVLNPLPINSRAITDGVFNVVITANGGVLVPQGASVSFRNSTAVTDLYRTNHDATTWSLIVGLVAGGEVFGIQVRRSDGQVSLPNGLVTPSISGNTAVVTQPPGTSNTFISSTAFTNAAMLTRLLADNANAAGFVDASTTADPYMTRTVNGEVVRLRRASLLDTATFGAVSTSKNIDTGEIFQYFEVSVGDVPAGGATFNVNFPFAFPNAVSQITSIVLRSTDALTRHVTTAYYSNLSNSGFRLQVDEAAQVVQPASLTAIVTVRGR